MSFISNFRQAFAAARAAEEALSAEAQAKAEGSAKAHRVGLGQQWEKENQELAQIELQAKAFREKGEVIDSLRKIDEGVQALIEALATEQCLPAQLAEREKEYLKENTFTKALLREAGFNVPSASIPTPVWQPCPDPSMNPWNTSI